MLQGVAFADHLRGQSAALQNDGTGFLHRPNHDPLRRQTRRVILFVRKLYEFGQSETELAPPNFTHHQQAISFAESRQAAVARVRMSLDVEQIEHSEALAFDRQMVPLNALAMDFALQVEITAQC